MWYIDKIAIQTPKDYIRADTIIRKLEAAKEYEKVFKSEIDNDRTRFRLGNVKEAKEFTGSEPEPVLRKMLDLFFKYLFAREECLLLVREIDGHNYQIRIMPKDRSIPIKIYFELVYYYDKVEGRLEQFKNVAKDYGTVYEE